MPPAFPLHLIDVDQLQICLVDQTCRVERVVGPFLTQAGVGELSELFIYDGHEAVERLSVAPAVGVEQLRHVRLR